MISEHKHGFIIGAPKCGTTSLAGWLDQHPEVCMSRPKESKFFTSEYEPWGFESTYMRNYFRHFRPMEGHKILVDANPMLMLAPFFADRIQCHVKKGNAKIIAMVREPIERMYSHWKMDVNMAPGRAHSTFDRALAKNLSSFDPRNFEFEGELPFNRIGGLMVLAYIEYGMYYSKIHRYIHMFGSDNVLVLQMNDLSRPKETFRRVCEFIEVDAIDVHFTEKNVSKTKTPSKKEILESFPSAGELIGIFSGQVHMLSNLTGIDFVKEWGYD